MPIDHSIVFAIDKSVRRVDQDGRLHVALTNISKANVCPYYGREIPGAAELGLKADQVYQVFRDPDALAKGAATFNNIPLLDEHIIVSADDPKKNSVVGSTGTDAVFDGDYLKNSLVVWDATAIARIESGEQKEISSAYRYVAIKEAGTHNGLPYELKMRNIVANHAALVREGRAGPDVVVADGAFGDQSMKFAALKGKLAAMFATDSALSTDDRRYLYLALDEMEADVEAEDEEMTEAEAKEAAEKKAADKKAKDAKAAKDKAAKDKAAKDAKRAADKKAKDEDWEPEEKSKDPEDQDKAAEDEDDDEDDKKAKDRKGMDKKAMDSAISAGIAKARAEWDALAKAKEDVRGIVGEVHNCDTAAKVYKFALDSKGITAKTDDPDVLAQMVGMIPAANTNAPRIALDAKSRGSVSDILPALGRYA